MKDWNTLEADETRMLGTHYTPGRQGHAIDKIVLHHNAGNLSIADCWNVWQTREASAHYQIDAQGRVGQLVSDADTAWHSGDWETNLTSIGIEHADISSSPWRVSGETLDAGAHLVAALCRYYKLGRPQWGVNVFPHSRFCATACPASLQNEQRDEYMSRAQAWYDNPESEEDMTIDELYSAQGSDGRNLFDSVIQTRSELRDRAGEGASNALVSTKGNDGRNVLDSVIQARWDIAELKPMLAAQTATIETLAKAVGTNPSDIAKIVEEQVKAKLDNLQINVTATEKEADAA